MKSTVFFVNCIAYHTTTSKSSNIIIPSLCFKFMNKINAHYVPQFYLKNFGNELFYYNIKLKSSKKTIPKKLACDKNLYGDLDKYTVNNIEQILSKSESNYSIVLSQILKDDKHLELSLENKKTLCSFVALQHVRTPINHENKMRRLQRISDKMTEKIGVVGYKIQFDDEAKCRLYLDNLNFTQMITELMMNMKIIILKNDTINPLWTSDNPVIIYNDMWSSEGIAHMGIQIYVPLSSNMAVLICDPTIYQNVNKVIIMNDNHIRFLNYCQIKHADTDVYSNTDKFYDIDDFTNIQKNKFPDNCNSILHYYDHIDFNYPENYYKKYHKANYWMSIQDLMKLDKKYERSE